MNATSLLETTRKDAAPAARPELAQTVGRVRGLNLLRGGVTYLLLGVALGVFMGASGDHSLRSVHTHINLFGWASMGLMGVIYLVLPNLALTRLAGIHVVLHHAGLASMMLGLAGKLHGVAGADPLLGVGSSVAALAIGVFAFNLLRYGRAS